MNILSSKQYENLQSHLLKNLKIKYLPDLKKAMPFVITASFIAGFSDACAGTGGEEFADVWDTLKEWIQGTLGRVVCGSMILVGIVAGVARQSISAFAVGIGGGIGLYNTPSVIESVLSATITPENIELLNSMNNTML